MGGMDAEVSSDIALREETRFSFLFTEGVLQWECPLCRVTFGIGRILIRTRSDC